MIDGLDLDYQWTQVTDRASFAPRDGAGALVFDDAIRILAGWDSRNLNDVWYSSDGISWREVPDTPWPARHAARVYVYDDAIWVIAGSHMVSDVWKLERS